VRIAKPRKIMERRLSTCYPSYKTLIRALRTIPLVIRSLLIKTCQAQFQFVQDSNSSLRLLMDTFPPVTVELDFNYWVTLPVRDLLLMHSLLLYISV
jgi:hypothetical protein